MEQGNAKSVLALGSVGDRIEYWDCSFFFFFF